MVPRIIAASSVYYGQGHPLNRTEILYPESEGYMPDDSTTGPRMSLITRRALLRGLLQALVAVKDIYRVGRASTCLHVCVSSKYLDLVWNEWLPNWEEHGWPTKMDETDRVQKDRMKSDAVEYPSINSRNKKGRERAASRASGRMSIRSQDSNLSALSGMTGDASLIYEDDSNRLVNEDLLRKIAIFRRNFFANSPSNIKGAAYIQLLHYRQNPADRLAKEAVSAAALDLTTQVPRSRSMGIGRSNGSVFSASDADSIRPMSPAANDGSNRIRRGSITSSKSAKLPIKKNASALPSITMAAPVEYATESPRAADKQRSLVPEAAPAIAPTTSPLQQPSLLSTPAPAVMISKRPASRERNLSSYAISEGGTETDMDDFNDAVSTFSEPQAPQSTLAKVAAIPTAAVAATVAAVMGPAQNISLLEPISVDEAASSSGRGSSVRDTNERPDTMKTPANKKSEKDDIVSGTSKSRREIRKKRESKSSRSNGVERTSSVDKTPVIAKRKSSVLRDAATATASAPTTNNGKRGSISKVESDIGRSKSNSASTRDSAAAAPAIAGATGVRRDASQRSTRAPVVASAPVNREVPRQSKVVEPPPKPKQRGSFFSLRRKEKEVEVQVKPAKSTSKATYKPPTDRLIDYRPPQSRNLSGKVSSRPADEGYNKMASPATSSPVDESPPLRASAAAAPEDKATKQKAATTGRGGPFSFFKKRGSVREVFAEA